MDLIPDMVIVGWIGLVVVVCGCGVVVWIDVVMRNEFRGGRKESYTRWRRWRGVYRRAVPRYGGCGLWAAVHNARAATGKVIVDL